ncbi:hypothetical protein PSECIP111854_04035 [Pseudoalteromonas sp. CIP111854]|uniref:Uncharacterized protein n=1 Tax=Pseudoalteromonas holothuriae TaxID=2963714 RepID=A0A9W4R509_9GAMM|nr:hypothetical protein [Pseudoalteromonas sp. CIP111854]CAH9067159.1 hypothetical protein PSECIP111854_04035 [Pseudoalteromonas sp. CIP111854]
MVKIKRYWQSAVSYIAILAKRSELYSEAKKSTLSAGQRTLEIGMKSVMWS